MANVDDGADWWLWATEWRAVATGLAHGTIEDALADFARKRGRTPSRIRRAAAAQSAAEALAADSLIPDAAVMSRIPLDDVESLKRLHRYGSAAVNGVLPLVLRGGLTGRDLAMRERQVRASSEPAPRPGRPKDQHSWRLAASGFRSLVLRDLADTIAASGGSMARSGRFEFGLPFPLDALARMPDAALLGIRIVGAKPGGDARSRQRELLLFALAATRFLHAVGIYFQDGDEAERMAEQLCLHPGCGIGVHAPGPYVRGERLGLVDGVPIIPAHRAAPPDLGSSVRIGLEERFKSMAEVSRPSMSGR